MIDVQELQDANNFSNLFDKEYFNAIKIAFVMNTSGLGNIPYIIGEFLQNEPVAISCDPQFWQNIDQTNKVLSKTTLFSYKSLYFPYLNTISVLSVLAV